MKAKKIPLAKIRLDGNTQPRVELDQDLIREYAESYKSGIELPPLDVYFDGVDYWLSDGFHRRWGGEKAGRDALPCFVYEGTLEDARWASYAANKSHGLRRTNEDKKKAVIAALKHPTGAKLSDVQIAEHVGASSSTVLKYRKELESTSQIEKSTERTGRDGRTINTANIGKGNGKPAPAENKEPDFSEQADEPDEPETDDEPEELDEPESPDSLEAVQEDLRELERQVRDLCRQVRKVLGAEGNEVTRPWCGCYSLLTLLHPLQHVARTILNDLPIGGTPDNPKLAREEAVEKAG